MRERGCRRLQRARHRRHLPDPAHPLYRHRGDGVQKRLCQPRRLRQAGLRTHPRPAPVGRVIPSLTQGILQTNMNAGRKSAGVCFILFDQLGFVYFLATMIGW